MHAEDTAHCYNVRILYK